MTCSEIIRWLLYGKSSSYIPLLNTGTCLPNFLHKAPLTLATFHFQRTAKFKNYVPSKSDIENSLQDCLVNDKQSWQEDIAYMEMLKNSRKRNAQAKNLRFKKYSNNSIVLLIGLAFLSLSAIVIISQVKNEVNKKLFEQFYIPLHTNLVIPVTSDISNHSLDKALREYSSKNYSKALSLFSNINSNSDLYYISQFYAGICDMELNHMEAALVHFNNTRQLSNLMYHVNWYKGLCNLHLGSLNEAILIFIEIKVSNSPYANEAAKILNQLRK